MDNAITMVTREWDRDTLCHGNGDPVGIGYQCIGDNIIVRQWPIEFA